MITILLININNIKILKDKFNCTVGFSDHTKGTELVKIAVAAGAEVIEKHIALEGQKKGFDIDFSLKGKQILKYKKEIEKTYRLLGKKYFYRNNSEKKASTFKRSIFAIQDIKKGEKFSNENIGKIRPGNGAPAYLFKKILTKKSPSKIQKANPITLKIIKKLKII